MTVKQTFISSAELNYPKVLPTLDLNFAHTKTLDPRIDFTRASGGSYVGADGLIKYAGVNEARFDHDPVTGESLGLLIEESRTNLFTWSERFDMWTRVFISVALNSASSPDGNFNAIQIIEDNTINAHYLGGSIGTITSGLPYTVSCFAKSTNPNRLFSLIFGPSSLFGGDFPRASFDLTSGKIHTITSATSATIENYGNGWYRCSLTAIPSVTGTFNIQLRLQTNVTADSMIGPYTGDGVSGLYLWGAQLEQGSFPTSYIPTQGSTRTRAADSASITGKNFSDFYNQSEGTIYSEAKGTTIFDVNTRRYWEISAESVPINRLLSGYLNSTQTRFLVVRNSQSSADIASFNQNLNSYVKSISTFRNNYYRIYSNGTHGTLGQTDNFGNLPSELMISLYLGNPPQLIPSTTLNGTIKRFTYYPKSLPNEQLQALTR